MVLLKTPNSFLSKQVELFDFEKLNPLEISDRMIETMEKNNGIGLSANQVGINAQIFVMKTSVGEYITAINPVIVELGKQIETGVEGCLSFPNLVLAISRPTTVTATFLDKYAQSCIMVFDGIDARCFLHEYDHLHGTVFTDLVSRLKLTRAKQQRKKHGRT